MKAPVISSEPNSSNSGSEGLACKCRIRITEPAVPTATSPRWSFTRNHEAGSPCKRATCRKVLSVVWRKVVAARRAIKYRLPGYFNAHLSSQ